MRGFLLLSLLLDTGAWAQNWALLNPAYRYNYSNDGTDTISNQIRVMHVDTLGPDSFRYELNRVGVICDTCPASLGGPCDGCYVRVDQPQFLGFECIRSGEDWWFFGPETFRIIGTADIGSSWLFNSSTLTTALIDDEWPAETWGSMDTIRRILLDPGDTILLSRSFGLLKFRCDGADLRAIGVEGPDVGHILPGPLDFFDYQPGDELTYRITYTDFVSGWDGLPTPVVYSHYWNVVITERTDLPDAVSYITSTAHTYGGSGFPELYPDWPIPNGEWVFSTSSILADHPLLAAYPGQVIDRSLCWYSSPPDGYTGYIAESGIGADGRALWRSRIIGNGQTGPASGFDGSDTIAPGLFPMIGLGMSVLYQEGLGVKYDGYNAQWAIQERVALVGAVIGGDTVIPLPGIDWDVAVEENPVSRIHAWPNPAVDKLTVAGAPGAILTMHDLDGRLVRDVKITMENMVVDVRDLRAGIYLVRIGDMRPQRLVIAH